MTPEHKLYDHATSRLGSELTPQDRQYVLGAFVHRFTRTHRPAWSRVPMPNGKAYPVQFASDAEWLANTRFATGVHGDVDRRATQCLSRPTWPDNPELRK